jgi:hypothetical protein
MLCFDAQNRIKGIEEEDAQNFLDAIHTEAVHSAYKQISQTETSNNRPQDPAENEMLQVGPLAQRLWTSMIPIK